MKDWVELFPYGVSLFASQSGDTLSRPILMLRDLTGNYVLPVWLSPLDAGIALSSQQKDHAVPSPHEVTAILLERLAVNLDRCCFTELKGHHLYAELKFKNSEMIAPIQIRADKAMSFCLQMKARFFARPDLIEACRVVEDEMVNLAKKSRKGEKSQRPKYLN